MCAICGEPIGESQDILGFSAWSPAEDLRFMRLADGVVHQRCIDGWDLRDDFIDWHNGQCSRRLKVNRRGHVQYQRDWFDWTTELLLLATFGLLLTPVIPLMETIDLSDSCLGQLLLALGLLAVLAGAASLLAASLGWPIAVTGVVGSWWLLGVIVWRWGRQR